MSFKYLLFEFEDCLSERRCISVEKKNQLDAAE